ncbi:MAG TPA: hypothetical protein VMU88_00795, partial [bacterium]|nr:hypothetical protein [bacterium]
MRKSEIVKVVSGMKQMTLGLVCILGFFIFPGEGQCGPAILSLFQGHWTVEKITRSPDGTSKTEMGDPTLGNHLVVIENKAQLVLNGKEYKVDLPEPRFIHAKLQELEMFNPGEKGSTDPRDLGFPPEEHVFILTFKDSPPFEKVILIDRYREAIIFVEGAAYLLKRIPVYPTDFSEINPHYDLAWAF